MKNFLTLLFLIYLSSCSSTDWPRPNRNTFVSHIIRNVSEMGVELPSNAIGKDWIDNRALFTLSDL